MLSADVLRDAAAGVAKAQAYATGFSHTLTMAVGIAAVGLALAILYERAVRERGKGSADGGAPKSE